MTKNTDRDPYSEVLAQILAEITGLRQEIETRANQRLQKYKKNFPSGFYSKSACNLAHYLAMRQFDLRRLQDRLAQVGLSSLGRAEASVISTFDALIDLLKRATGEKHHLNEKNPNEYGLNRGQQLLEQHTIELFGPFREHGDAHVMVTLGSEAAWDYGLVNALLNKGMTCARINCAHDDLTAWQGMINNIRRAEAETGRSCRILMDLAGHKIRTGAVALGSPIHHIKVKKDQAGKIISLGYLILTVDIENLAPDISLFRISIPQELHQQLAPDMCLGFRDSRGKERQLKIKKALFN